MNAEILCVGTELLLGDIVNTNAAFLARELAALGIGCYYQSVVGDNPGRLRESLELALSRADVVITTGGLGPTYDDLTKETVAQMFCRGMELHEPSLEAMRRFFGRIGRKMTPNNEKQALMPEGAVVFPNDRGTAPGLAVEGDGKRVILLPGPPREMTAMFTNQVRPYLAKLSDTVLVSQSIHLFGIGESNVEDRLHDEMQARTNPTVAPYAKEGEVMLRVTASAGTAAEAEEMIQPVVDEIRGIFPQYVYGVDVGNLQTALVQALREKNLTIATAESCTGGLISARLIEIPGASSVFGCGVCAYSNDTKTKLLGVSGETIERHGTVSRECALEMARGVRALAGADIGVSVTGVAGPDGGTEEKPVGLVYVAVCGPGGEECRDFKLSRGYAGDRAIIRNMAAMHAMNMALRQIWQEAAQ